jgi:BirA family transcriptional regulator, biotin operon repressor / biotin---[acetyl-CoA-carboxylase] ligase
VKPLDIDEVLRRLPGRRISFFESLDSTMHEAARLAAAGVPAGTAVVAEEQTAGQGRHGHAWHSAPGCGLYVSIVLRPRMGMERMPALTLALGLAAAEAIGRSTDLSCDLRWPNDLMLEGRKAAGILVQLFDGTAVAGIGINVNHAAFPEELAQEATSLRLAGGRVYSREDLLIELLPAVDRFLNMLVEAGSRPVLDMFERRSSYARGKRVRVDRPEGVIIGTTAGLDDGGFLRVRRDEGGETLILAGGVRAISA